MGTSNRPRSAPTSLPSRSPDSAVADADDASVPASSPVVDTAAAHDRGPSADVLIVFGITGDLARKMTFRALFRLERRGLLDCPIIGVASADLPVDHLVKRARAAISAAGETLDDTIFDRLAGRLSYVHGDVTGDAVYRRLAE